MYTIPPALDDAFGWAYVHQRPFMNFMMGVPLELNVFEPKDEEAQFTACAYQNRVDFCQSFLDELNYRQTAFVLCHEIVHHMLQHPKLLYKWKKAGQVTGQLHGALSFTPTVSKPFDMQIAQMALDYIVNDWLYSSGLLDIPKDACWDRNIATAVDLEEDVYIRLYINPPPQSKRPSTGEDVVPDGAASSPLAELRHEKAMIEAIESMDPSTMRGIYSSNLMQRVKQLHPKKEDWRDVVRPRYEHVTGTRLRTWRKFDRTMMAMGQLMQGLTDTRAGNVGLILDTSGSMTSWIEPCLASVGYMFAQNKPRSMVLLEVDAAVQRVTHIRTSAQLTEFQRGAYDKGVAGGGGTILSMGFEWFKAQGQPLDLILVFTDMYTDFPANMEPAREVIWCATTDAKAPTSAGRTVRMWHEHMQG